MSDIRLSALDTLEISIQRTDDDYGSITVIVNADDSSLTISAGDTQGDADALVVVMQEALREAVRLRDEWEERPDLEADGFVSEQRGGYSASLSGTVAGYDFPSREIAVYELAKLITDSGYSPDLWYQNERGNTYSINSEIDAYLGDNDELKPLEGVKYLEGDQVLIGSYDYPYVVDRDYGKLGVMLHISRDPSITEFEQHENLKPYPEDEGE